MFSRLLAARGRAALTATLAFIAPIDAIAHGFAGDRFFPATILTDDPFVADELSLPTVSRQPTGPDGAQQIDVGANLSKRLTPDIGITLGDQWQRLKPSGLPSVTGFATFDAELDYQFFTNAPHEAVAMIGMNTSFAHTGRVQALGAADFTTVSPLLDFGKGFGDLPDSLPWLRPAALTGNFSVDFPTKTESAGSPNPNNINYGFAFEYSLEYLQHHVRDVGLTPPFDRMIPLVEVAFSTAVNRAAGGQTVGTIQPGLIWAGQYVQIGAEAIIPATHDTGHGFGGVIQLHFYLDDLFPRSIGRPLSGF
ncbi:MAG: hypothetical protein JO267_12690 [Alphaproteobacteria bacterium]|nr:hypothetical protein [Alphaproteobacteria bacterium]MBV9862990.1 hypothetical protein [Alphaproteobacteria bacterium]